MGSFLMYVCWISMSDSGTGYMAQKADASKI